MITLPTGLVVAVALGAALLVVGLFLESRMLRRELRRLRRDRDVALAEERLPLSLAAACDTNEVEEAARRVREWRQAAEDWGDRGQPVSTRQGRGA